MDSIQNSEVDKQVEEFRQKLLEENGAVSVYVDGIDWLRSALSQARNETVLERDQLWERAIEILAPENQTLIRKRLNILIKLSLTTEGK